MRAVQQQFKFVFYGEAQISANHYHISWQVLSWAKNSWISPKKKGKFTWKMKLAKARCHQVRGRKTAKDTVNSEQSNHTLAPLGGLASVLVEKSGQEDSLWSQGHIWTKGGQHVKETTGLFDFDFCPSRRILDSWSLNALVTETCMFKNILGLTQYPRTDTALVCTMLHKSALYFTCIVPVGSHRCPVGTFIIIIYFIFLCCLWTDEIFRGEGIVVLEKTWEFPGQQGDQTSQFQGKLTLNIHWKDWCWSWTSNILDTWWEELTHWKRPWCWERLKAGEGCSRGWDGWITSLI